MTMVSQHYLFARKLLDEFGASLAPPDRLERMAADLIGKDINIVGPFGSKRLVYADYVASGRALMCVEQFIMQNVLPYYANSHTEASYCGGAMTGFRRAARETGAACFGATGDHAVIFTGSGATSGLNRLVILLGSTACMMAGVRPRCVVGPY